MEESAGVAVIPKVDLGMIPYKQAMGPHWLLVGHWAWVSPLSYLQYGGCFPQEEGDRSVSI